MKFMEELDIALEYKGDNDMKLSFSCEIPYEFASNNYNYSLMVSKLDELSIRRKKQNCSMGTIYCICTDKTNKILKNYLNENSMYVESDEELNEEAKLHGISYDIRVIKSDKIKQDIISYCGDILD